jgi:hypothetical protein
VNLGTLDGDRFNSGKWGTGMMTDVTSRKALLKVSVYQSTE